MKEKSPLLGLVLQYKMTLIRPKDYSKLTIPALIGEIFAEEDRSLSKVYEAILRTVGAGRWNYKEVANILYGRNIVNKADSSVVLPYIKFRRNGLNRSFAFIPK
jgi:hypothetical protein